MNNIGECKIIYCNRHEEDRYPIKELISLERNVDNAVIIKTSPLILKPKNFVEYVYLSVTNSIASKKALKNMFNGSDMPQLEAIYQLYGDYDFCVELRGNKEELAGIRDKVINEIESNGLLFKKDKKRNPLVKTCQKVYKLNGVEFSNIKNGIYVIDLEKTKSMGAFVHVPIYDDDISDTLYKNTKVKLSKKGLESFLFSAALCCDFSNNTFSMWFMLLAECGEYYKLNDVSDVIDEVVENEKLKKTTFPIAGVMHHNVNDTKFKMGINLDKSSTPTHSKSGITGVLSVRVHEKS